MKPLTQVFRTLKLNEATDAEVCSSIIYTFLPSEFSSKIAEIFMQLCMIGNVCPENVDEVYALIPSLKV